MPEINQILFVQRRDVLEKQRSEVERTISSKLNVPVAFASSPDEVPKGANYDVVITPTVPWLDELLSRLPKLRWVHFLSAGIEKIWTMNFNWGNVALSKSSGVHAAPMSEYAMGAMLYFAKDFNRFVMHSRNRQWQRHWLGELTDKYLLVLGMGSVGSAVADRATAFGMNIVGIATEQRAHYRHRIDGVERMYEHLAVADYVVLTLPLTSHTKDLGNEEFFDSMKDGTVLIDISRGGIIRSEYLIAALDAGKLKGAALDVFEEEPLAQSSSLWDRPDILLTPHVAGTTPSYLNRALDIFVKNAQLYENDEPLKTAVDQANGY
jgi:phosphoglycerate dehydrogenase-like enzyme